MSESVSRGVLRVGWGNAMKGYCALQSAEWMDEEDNVDHDDADGTRESEGGRMEGIATVGVRDKGE